MLTPLVEARVRQLYDLDAVHAGSVPVHDVSFLSARPCQALRLDRHDVEPP